jgi:hypothetical protein
VDFTRIGQATSATQFCRQIGGLVGAAGLGALLGFGLVGALRTELSDVPGAGAARDISIRGAGVDALLAKIGASVQAEMHRRFDAVCDAAAAGDSARLEQCVLDDDAATRKMARDLLNAPEQARAEMLPRLRGEFDREGADVMVRVANGIRSAFAAAVTRVYTCVAFVVGLGWLVTWLLPELPLRKTHR